MATARPKTIQAKRPTKRKSKSRRETVQPHSGDKRYVRRSRSGRFTENQSEVGRSLSRDRRSKAKRIVPKGQGDRGDQKR
jgi:hypothetical protein